MTVRRYLFCRKRRDVRVPASDAFTTDPRCASLLVPRFDVCACVLCAALVTLLRAHCVYACGLPLRCRTCLFPTAHTTPRVAPCGCYTTLTFKRTGPNPFSCFAATLRYTDTVLGYTSMMAQPLFGRFQWQTLRADMQFTALWLVDRTPPPTTPSVLGLPHATFHTPSYQGGRHLRYALRALRRTFRCHYLRFVGATACPPIQRMPLVLPVLTALPVQRATLVWLTRGQPTCPYLRVWCNCAIAGSWFFGRVTNT